MKIIVGSLTQWQRSVLLVALYNNIAKAKGYAPLHPNDATRLVEERKSNIQHVNELFIGVDLNAPGGELDLSKYNQQIGKVTLNGIKLGEDILHPLFQHIGLKWVLVDEQATKKPVITRALTVITHPKDEPKGLSELVKANSRNDSFGFGC